MAALNGLYRAAKRVVDWLPTWLLRFRPFGVYEIRLPKTGGKPATPQFSRGLRQEKVACQIRWIADQNEVPMLRQLAGDRSCAALNFKTRRAVAAWYEGQVIACAWIATESFEEVDLGLRFELQTSDAWLFAAVVDERQRNQGVYRQLLEFLIDELGRDSMRRLLFGVSVGNAPSQRAHARQGAILAGGIFAVRSLGLTLCFRRGRVRRLTRFPITRTTPIRLAVSE
jgi:GNAT superfamily N-acetyltransferase